MFFVLDEHHNLIEAYDKEGVLAVLEKAIADGSLSGITENSAIVSKLKCCVTGGANRVAFVTQAKYNELKASDSFLSNCIYFITDSTEADDLDALLTDLTEKVNGMISGSQMVGNASKLDGVSIQTSGDTCKFAKGGNITILSRTIVSTTLDNITIFLAKYIVVPDFYPEGREKYTLSNGVKLSIGKSTDGVYNISVEVDSDVDIALADWQTNPNRRVIIEYVVERAKNADNADNATKANKVSGMTVGTGTASSTSAQYSITEVGIYLASICVRENSVDSYVTGVICIPTLDKVSNASVQNGTLKYTASNKNLDYTASGSKTVVSMKVYRLGDV